MSNSESPGSKTRLSITSSRDGHSLYQPGSVITASLYDESNNFIKEIQLYVQNNTCNVDVEVPDNAMFIDISVEEQYISIDGKNRSAGASDETRVSLKGGTVNVRYVNLDDKEIAPAETITGKYNAPYEVQQKAISGYTFVKDVDNNRKGNIPKQGETVTVTLQYKEGDEKEEGGKEFSNNGCNNNICTTCIGLLILLFISPFAFTKRKE